MKSFLTYNQIEYTLFHLRQSVVIEESLRAKFCFIKSIDEIENYSNKVIFLMSDKEYSAGDELIINSIPVLFGNKEKTTFYEFDSKGNLVFYHDLLKSAFYLLSGYQEYISDKLDSKGRFSFKGSIQEKLKMATKPIVNYYFEIIIQALKEYSIKEGIEIIEEKLFKPFGFCLTHDVDKIRKFSLRYFLYSIKRFIPGSNVLKSGFGYKLFELFDSFFGLIKLKKDPYWNFDFMLEKEQERKLKAAYYFLDEAKDEKNYDFSEPKLKELYKMLKLAGSEMGIHGTINSASSSKEFAEIVEKLKDSSGENIHGNRFHNLVFQTPDSMKIIEENQLKYDTSLAFADHEGFRNSYCLPFKLFDFKADRMIDVWELPLNVMDNTLLQYRALSFKQAKESIEDIILEIRKFGGVFTLLWHNSYFDEKLYPGITNFYTEVLDLVRMKEPIIKTPMEFINEINN